MSDTSSPVRLFFALWPPEAVREQLARLARKIADHCPGRPVRPENLHLTLAFLGETDRNMIPALRQAGSVIQNVSFDLLLDKLYCWGKGNIIAAGISQNSHELAALAQELRNQLTAAGVRYDMVKFVPHVTLVRNAKCNHISEIIRPVTWTATHWSLVQSRLSQYGSVYQSLADWTLAPPDN
ncbi:RNA 2',3'-cyclic phosphodiesterase [Nitrosomonas sp.]|uniref:RNA 2',3'-cyclic phosphodiesterase n=1 Tax=Nitrosomonas sp. TaxID=42353 RepID=UPI0025D06AE0|nr:RNA 2',3'-cyclic phosphodiesterase [Nitrosomonas sp.]MCC6917507.1 RNA 2',3'-cyclic phosphodiesterase [Nitrosomonas sp.]